MSKILIAFYSEYFRAAFEEGRFVEGTENKVSRLSDTTSTLISPGYYRRLLIMAVNHDLPVHSVEFILLIAALW